MVCNLLPHPRILQGPGQLGATWSTPSQVSQWWFSVEWNSLSQPGTAQRRLAILISRRIMSSIGQCSKIAAECGKPSMLEEEAYGK